MFKRLGVVVVLLAAVVTLADAQPKPVRPFTFILDFLPYGEYTPYFTALDKGWYREEGLDVKILRGAGSSDTIKRIAVGQGEAGNDATRRLAGEEERLADRVRRLQEGLKQQTSSASTDPIAPAPIIPILVLMDSPLC